MPAIILGLFVMVCSALQTPGDEVITRVSLRISDSIDVDGGRLSIGFEEVISDSRCPRGYKCVVAGEAKIRIWVLVAGESRESHVLTGPGPVRHLLSGQYSVQFTTLDPYPEPGRERQPVRATLVIRRLDR